MINSRDVRYPNVSDEMMDEIEQKASELQCSLQLAEYIVRLERTLSSFEKQVTEWRLWVDYQQRHREQHA